jgi:hypothetical protein
MNLSMLGLLCYRVKTLLRHLTIRVFVKNPKPVRKALV